ncbi:hypothetical protein TRAPUB_2984 [Trametes pubescens]|uniref:RRM domain-containing protein n=1 Tax=Trametes pubescens TaxID=154538 RepID=A0A1M2VF07_TRAPU|nr:hypothetical protein TRAPUB_2984 [Trametes pubescens]
MAASPIATSNGEEQEQTQQNILKWSSDTMDVEAARDHMGPGGDIDLNGASHPADDRSAPGQETADYPAAPGSATGSAGDAAARAEAAQRGEKLVKPNKVYIGGLPEHTRKEDLESCFGKIGNIVNIELKECPNHLAAGRRPGSDAPLIDRIQPPREYPVPPRDYYRDYPGYLPPRDPRYYEYPPPPVGRDGRYGRPPSPPPRDVRDYPPPPIPVRSARDYDDYRIRGPPPPPARYDSRGFYPEGDPLAPGYPARGYPPPPPREFYDRDYRRALPADRYGSYPPPPAVRPRTPPGAPPARSRDDYERPPARDYPPATEARGRPVSPPPARYAEYPPRSGSVEAPRYRRRSQSPPSRSASGAPYEASRYESGTGGAAYAGGTSGSYPSNGYTATNGGAPPPARSATATREYAPPRATRDPEPVSSYRRS